MRAWLSTSTPSSPRLLLCLLDWNRVVDAEEVAAAAAAGAAGPLAEALLPAAAAPPPAARGYCGHFVVVLGFDSAGRVVYYNPESLPSPARPAWSPIRGAGGVVAGGEPPFAEEQGGGGDQAAGSAQAPSSRRNHGCVMSADLFDRARRASGTDEDLVFVALAGPPPAAEPKGGGSGASAGAGSDSPKRKREAGS